jgi:hypothetical protein
MQNLHVARPTSGARPVIVDGIDLATLSADELKALKRRWYEGARGDGTLAAIGRVVRSLGTRRPKKHGANWTWSDGDVTLGLDDWTGTLRASVRDRLVCYTGTPELFVPGPWLDVVRGAEIQAQAVEALRDGERERADRQALLRELGGIG